METESRVGRGWPLMELFPPPAVISGPRKGSRIWGPQHPGEYVPGRLLTRRSVEGSVSGFQPADITKGL